ncbi:uncharacterized protein LOC128638161 isoform X1 [Bombina bombina]|uniref:uncharacterized protein LOC128638161 isoform X1 n=1 Tax=Bombina bombina TaxID=8345 RepID=UPI00235A512F|nr:uncharacterized protein LOC128638161 isoform X1 [Bombina bombina]
MYDSSEYLEIVNNRGSSGIINRYKGRTSLVRNGRDSCTLKISNLTRYDGNKYYTVTDGNWLIDQFVDQQRRIQLLIKDAPKGVHIVSSKTKDDYIELICTFLSSRPNVTGYIWFIDDIFIHNYTKQILKLENLQTNSGKYYCVAHNKVGLTKSSSLQINITDKQKEIAQSGTLQILIILAAIIFLIMAIILLYFCIRKRKFCITSKGNNNNQDTQSSDAVYTELMKRETSSEYAQLKLEKHLLVPEKRMDINRNLEYENLGEQI